MPANATDEQKAEWRKAQGLPEKAQNFVEKLALPNGIVVGESDKPLVGDLANFAYEKGWSQDQFNDLMGWYYDAQKLVETQREQGDAEHKHNGMQSLMQEWGSDYKANMNAAGTLYSQMPEELRVNLFAARTPTGELLGNTAGFNKWAAEVARQLNPAATVIPMTGDQVAHSTSRLADIEKMMGDYSSEYWRGPKAESLQAEYRVLTEQMQRMQSRNRAA